MKAFLLCAGEGTRFKPHTDTLPKVILPFLNVPLVAYNAFLLKQLGVQSFAANVYGKNASLLSDTLQNIADSLNMSLHISYENQLLGSAGGLKKVEQFLSANDEDFYYLNGDSMMWLPQASVLQSFYKKHKANQALVSFLCIPSDPKSDVLFANSKGAIHSFHSVYSNNLFTYHFCGLALISCKIFQHISFSAKHLFYDVLEKLCQTGKIFVHSVTGLNSLDMNRLSSYLEGTDKVLKTLVLSLREQPIFLQEILNIFSPKWNVIQLEKGIIFCGKNVQGLSKLKVTDFAVLGESSRIMSSCHISRAVLNKNYVLNCSVSNDLLI